MLDALVRFSVRQRGIVIALAAAFLVYGVTVVARTKYDVFPEFAPPQVAIQTEAPGLTPEQVEVLVTKPLEDAINGVAGVAAVRSQSVQGLSVITAVFAEGSDVFRARQSVAERLGEIGRRLPESVRPPAITPLTATTGTVIVTGITSPTRTLRDQRTFADWTMRPRLLAVPGVSRVTVFGGEVRQLQVRPDPVRLRAVGLTISDVVAATRSATGVRGAGVIAGPNQEIRVRTEGQLTTAALLARSVIRERNGAVLRLGDVARVVEGTEPRIGAASIEAESAVILVVDAQLGANVRAVSAAVDEAVAELAPTVRAEGMMLHPSLFRPTEFVDTAIRNVTHALALGGVLVAVVLMLFLADLGAAAVSLTAIPLSLLAAVVVLDAFGLTINTLTLGGLAIAIGEVVDDAIIDVENIARRLRENRGRPDPSPVAEVVLNASLEVRSSVVYATFIVVLVFVPVIALTGVQGAMFRPLGLAYACAILASLVVALTVTPAMTLTFLARRRGQRAGEPAVLEGLKRGYTRQLATLGRHPKTVMVASASLVVLSIALLPFFGGEFLPEFNEGHLRVHMVAVPGTSLDESLRIGAAATASLRADPRVRSVAQRVGRAEAGEDTFGPHYSEFEVSLISLSGEEAETITADLRARLGSIPGVSFTLMPYLTERIEETLSGSTAPVVVKIFGDDLDSLDLAASRVANLIAAIRGSADVQTSTAAVAPEVAVRLRPSALASAGITSADALDAVETATQGLVATQVYEGNRATDVVVTLGSELLARPEDLLTIPLAASSGRIVPLGDVADVYRTTGRYVVEHEGARRVQKVTANVAGRDVASFASELQTRLRTATTTSILPRGVYAELSGSAAAQSAAQRELLARSALTAFGIGLLLWLAFGDWRRLLLVVANVPFALVGGVLAVALTGASLSLGSLVGFVTLFGITMRNAIMLISHYAHLVEAEGVPWGPATAIRGAAERLGPILMTALVTGLGLLPLAIGAGNPGKEIEGPLAIVILGGLVTSTALSLFVLPTLALRFGRFAQASDTSSPLAIADERQAS